MKAFVVIGFIIFSSIPIVAQNTIGVRAHYGGYQLLTDIETFEQKIKFDGYSAGLVFQHYDEKFAGIQVEINMVRKGMKEIDSVFYLSRSATYVELPIMTHLSLGKRNLKFLFNFGPNLMFKLSDNTNISHANSKLENSQFNTLPIANFEYGLVVGIGVAYTFPFGQIAFESRLNHGLSNMLKLPDEGQLNQVQTQFLHFGISYFFGVKPVSAKD